MNQITAYLSDDERPFWLFPFGEIVAGSGVKLDLDADEDEPSEGRLTRATALKSMQEWISHYRPPILREHERNGESYGEIVRVVEVTEEQAREWDVEQRGDAVWGVARLHPTMRDAYDDGRLRTTSPHLAMSYTDDEGTLWPLAMLELSAVSDPRQKGRQVTTDRLSGVRLSESSPRITITQTHEAKMGEEYEARLASCEAALVEIKEQLADVADKMGQLMEGESESEEMADDKPDKEMSEGKTDEQMSEGDDPRDAIIERLSNDLAKMQDERATERAELRVDAALAERQLDPSRRDHYVEIAKSNQALFDEIVAVAPERPQRKVGSSVGTGVTGKSAPGSVERFLELKEELGSASKANEAWLKEVQA